MTETEITFHNKAEIRVQAQIFAESTLVSTCVVSPGETCTLLTTSARYDVYLKNGSTGWEVARKLNSAAKSLALSRHKGRYVIT
jgi:D-arabinose 1-dehydrogenase-like Zn-dependent alcohol dehydrogenase